MPDPKAPSPNYNPYGKAAKGESKAAATKRRSKFYTFQRQHAEETGDQATSDKINKKLGRPSRSVDADAVNKKALAYGPALAAGGAVGLGRLGAGAAASTAAKALARGGGQKALGAGMKVAKPVAKAASKAAPKGLSGGVSRLTTTGQKALPAGRAALPGARASQAVPEYSTQRALPKGKSASTNASSRGRSVKAGAKPRSSKDEVGNQRMSGRYKNHEGKPTRSGIKKTSVKKGAKR